MGRENPRPKQVASDGHLRVQPKTWLHHHNPQAAERLLHLHQEKTMKRTPRRTKKTKPAIIAVSEPAPPQAEEPIRLLFVLADLHCGSTAGLLPPGMTTAEDAQPMVQNKWQEWLWECWDRAMRWRDKISAGSKYGLVLNGDLTEGIHHRSTQVVSGDMADHVSIAKHVIAPIADAAEKVYIVKGTECHTHSAEVAIGEAIGAEMNQDTKKRAFDRLHLTACGVPCVFRHHIGTSMRMSLEATQLSVILVEEMAEAVKNGEIPPRIVASAHRHKFGFYQNGRSMCIVSAPWQGLTRHGNKVVSQARTQPGIYALDWRGITDGELPILHYRTYDTPPQATNVL